MRDMSLTLNDGTRTLPISQFGGGILQDSRLTPAQPLQKFVEIPGRSKPLDISRAATGNMAYSSEVREYDVAIVGNDNIAGNDNQGRTLVNFVNGKVITITDHASTYDAECSITKYERVGEYVLLTIQAVVI